MNNNLRTRADTSVKSRYHIFRTFDFTIYNILLSGFIFLCLIGADYLYWKPLNDFSVGENGIHKYQDYFTTDQLTIWKNFSRLGGGAEVVTLCAITFLLGRRPKFFYYLLAFSFDKGITNFFKMIYHMPRPYMTNENVKAYECSK